MSSVLDNYLGLNQQALKIHSRRAEILAGNLANADTPNFKARDIDFKAALQQVQMDSPQATLRTTHANHIATGGSQASSVDSILGELKYRIPGQPSIDGNTVDPLREKSAFMENAMLYQTNMRFLSGKIKSLKAALKVD
jgi:flagellar basal-body rod protein FlgB